MQHPNTWRLVFWNFINITTNIITARESAEHICWNEQFLFGFILGNDSFRFEIYRCRNVVCNSSITTKKKIKKSRRCFNDMKSEKSKKIYTENCRLCSCFMLKYPGFVPSNLDYNCFYATYWSDNVYMSVLGGVSSFNFFFNSQWMCEKFSDWRRVYTVWRCFVQTQ